MKLARLTISLMLLSGGVIAQDIKVVGSVDQPISLNSTNNLNGAMTSVKHISLLKVELSNKARQKIANRAVAAFKHSQESLPAGDATAPTTIQLGMGSVPVLDQGSYGTCATFSNTAAVDAVLKKGDYISQTCQLELGMYLETNGYNPSGWDGSTGPTVLNQMTAFGVVSKYQQSTNGCGGLNNYPQAGTATAPGTGMLPEDYHAIGEAMDPAIVGWSSVVDSYDVFSDKTSTIALVAKMKTILQAGDRLTFGVLLPLADEGVAGALGKHHVTNDSWVLTPEIVADLKTERNLPGHEMIITGYDDNAVAVDAKGRSYKGFFTLRNSWSQSAGDKGNFYMSYAYFETLVMETQRIRHLS